MCLELEIVVGWNSAGLNDYTWYFFNQIKGSMFPIYFSSILYFKNSPLCSDDEKYSEIVSLSKCNGNNVTIFYIREEKSCKIDTFVQLYVDRSQL